MRKILTILSLISLTYISAATLTTDKPIYTTTDTIKVNFSEMDNHHKDWIGIYPKRSSNSWKNVVKWAWTKNRSEGTLTFKNLPSGKYEVRAFYNNSYNVEATKTFKVRNNNVKNNIQLSVPKDVFTTKENVLINFKHMKRVRKNWIAIYPANSNNNWKNIIKWKFNRKHKKEGQINFHKLPIGKYEARVFSKYTFKMKGKVPFSVVDKISPLKATLTTPNPAYFKAQPVTLNFNHLSKNATIVIYNPWDNKIITSRTINNQKKGTVTFENLPSGYHQARVFYNEDSAKIIAKHDFTIVTKKKSDFSTDINLLHINRSTKACEIDSSNTSLPDFFVWSSYNDKGGQEMKDWYIFNGDTIKYIKSYSFTAHNYMLIKEMKKGVNSFKMLEEYWHAGGKQQNSKYYRVDMTGKLLQVSAEDAKECSVLPKY